MSHEAVPQYRCVRCGRAGSASLNSCPDCGGAIAAVAEGTPVVGPAPVTPAARPKPPRPTGLYWFLGIVFTCGFVGFIALGLYAKDNPGRALAKFIQWADRTPKGQYPTDFSREFVPRCTEQRGGNKTKSSLYCECLMEEAGRRIEFEAFLEMSFDKSKAETQTAREWDDIQAKCQSKSVATSAD